MTHPLKTAGLLLTLALGVVVVPQTSGAEQSGPISRVGVVRGGPDTPEMKQNLGAFRQGLREQGYLEGQNLAIEYRFLSSEVKGLPALMAELVRQKVDVILAIAPAAVDAARKTTTTIPIVALDLETDPIAGGLAESLARPGGNVTGVFLDLPELSGKWLQLLKETVPQLSRVAVLWDPTTGFAQMRGAEVAAKPLGLTLQPLETRTRADFEGAFRAAAQGHAGAMLALSSPLFNSYLRQIATLAANNRLPTIMLFPRFAEEGGLMAYGPNLLSLFKQEGAFVGKILKGAKPGQLPIERPIRFELAVNLRTAKALGVKIPPSVIVQADRVIE